ncbi:hybrid sensor histidine kinase/response regulator [Alsobacter metallidurans]|uniref:Sensory/regulatory protein RpfC n=1 Tax=Alsobacter metallidurans TaxID=340221 RepID=A0A917I419_9HYPH|nr:ATP-binding protein [Alsobacter metallidurans]GGH08057.1 hybrid sensor histidine kinase/response regulator [Alsobacter metallidurans]
MNALQFSTAGWLSLLVFGSLSALALIAAALLLRDYFRIEARAAALEAKNEKLQDHIWELRESEDRYRSLIEGQDDLILRRDQAGRLTYANEAFVALAAVPREQLLGAEFQIPALETSDERQGDDGSRSYDQAIATEKGQRWISWLESPVRSARGETEIQAVGRDITDRREAEAALAAERAKAQAANEAKSRFLATVSHEIRTPLNGVLGMADLLMGTKIDPEQHTYVRAVKTSGEALLSIIDEILDFSKIEAGKLELSAEPFDLAALVEGAVELLAPRAQGKGIEIAGFVAANARRMVVGDAARLRQVLTNLAGNAVKFTDEGGVGVLVERDAAGRIAFSVSDTGVGIPADRLARIFEEFEQVDGSASSRHGGTGLGLTISRRLVAGMGGELTVTSEPGRGSVFAFSLDFEAADAGPDAASASPALSFAGMTALVVSRSPFEGPFMLRRLQELGVRAHGVTTTQSAVVRLNEGGFTPDLLVIDGAVGEDDARMVAALAKRCGVVRRLVLLSPFERRSFGPPSAAGFDGYLVKPVRARALASRLEPESEAAPAPIVADIGGAQPDAPKHAGPAAQGMRVLLAEDNDINALLATKLMQRMGASVDWAKNGREAVARFEGSLRAGERYDLVLMDVRMPELDGHEATRQVRELESRHGAARVRIVALTANAFEEDRGLALASGMDATVAKPLDPAALTRAIGLETLARTG